ncbi:PREDICTED: uncharacterized protein LOC101618340 [Condylura cristata]|uniref:uncharacterized protein LOC101618340 n=1 Tax=Condylura cristata TaxID=143302 RepID=UPI0003343BF6|nr:PREDICTED: uncharacterized protein LOC101618340 [Condylura cristata]
MEATKKVGGPDPSGPQAHPSASSQQLGGSLRGSQGPWINPGSLCFKQGLSLPTETISDGACGPTPSPTQQLLRDPAEVNSQCGCEQVSQHSLRHSNSLFPSPIVGAHTHLITESENMALPMCTRSDSNSDTAQLGSCRSRFQVHLGRQSKVPAKVLVGWGKGPCSTEEIVPLGTRKSRWLPYILSEENDSTAAQTTLPAPAQDQDQGKCSCLAQAPPTPTQANTPALPALPLPAAVDTYNCSPDHLAESITITKASNSQDLLLRKYDDQWSILLEPSKVVIPCQNKVNFCSQEEPPTPQSTLAEGPDHVKDFDAARSQVLPMQPENPAEKALTCTSRPASPPPVSVPPGTPEPQRSSLEICISQPDQKPFSVCNNACSSVPAHQVTCCKQSSVQVPKEAMQVPLSSAPTCQRQDAVEDRVLVFDMATGNTRMGLLCHDPMGSRAVLVGLMPSHAPINVPENMSTPPMVMPILSPNNDHSSLWSTSPIISSPVPSSLSSGSYREVSLAPKEARLNLESQDSLGIETPIRIGMLAGPVPLGMPLQFGEGIRCQVHDPGWPKPDAENTEPGHTIQLLDASRMQDASMIEAKKLQGMSSKQTLEPAVPLTAQEAPKSLFQEDVGSHSWKKVMTAHPNNPHAKGAEPPHHCCLPSLAEQHPLTGKTPIARQPPPKDQPPSSEQPPPSKQCLLPDCPHLTGTPLARKLSLTGQIPFSQESPITKEPALLREPIQASTLCQEGESVGRPTNVGILRVPLAPEDTCVCVSRGTVGHRDIQSSNTHQLPWQPTNSPRAQEDQMSLITFTTPGPGCKVLPMAMVDTEPQSARFKLKAEDIPNSSVVAQLGLLRGACYELVPPTDVLPVQSPVLCRHSLGPYQDMKAVVIDTGTGFTKCGLAGEDHVLSVVPSRVQLLQHPVQGQPRYAVPENRDGSHSILNRGVVSDWDALEVLWQHLFYCRLRVQPEELAVLVADSPISPRTNREKVAEILFERFHVPAMQTVHQALLALYAYGRTTGLVLGSGYGTSYVAPILTGDLAPLDTFRLDVAGSDLTEYLSQLLLASGHSPPKAGMVNQIKEACCYVAMDMAAEMARTQTMARVEFVLPDKQVITLGSERFCCPEALFQPSLLGLNQPGLPQLALLSISRLEAKQQEQLLANVVLEGGSTLVSGFPERLRLELGPRATVLGSPHRAVAAWLGGSIMASRDSFQNLWLSRREYEEEGPWAIYKYQL